MAISVARDLNLNERRSFAAGRAVAPVGRRGDVKDFTLI